MGWVQSLFDSGLKEVQCQVKKQRERWEATPRGGLERCSGHRTLPSSLSWITKWGGTETSAPNLTNIPPPSNLFFTFLPQWPFWNAVRADGTEKVAFMLGHWGRQKMHTLQDVHVLIPRTCAYVPLHGKRALLTWFGQGSSDGALPCIIWVAQCNHKSPFKRDRGGSERAVMTEAEVRMIWPISKEQNRPISDFWPPDL